MRLFGRAPVAQAAGDTGALALNDDSAVVRVRTHETPAAAAKRYIKEARRWDQDYNIELIRSRRIAWSVAGVAGVLAITSVAALLALTPLKAVEPFVIRVNDTTGAVDVMSALKDDHTMPAEAVGRYFVGEYVKARESYLAPILEDQYRRVALFSDQRVQRVYADQMTRGNPVSPINKYGRRVGVSVKLRSISFITAAGASPAVVSVRFSREVREGDDVKTTATNEIATVTFVYTKADMAIADRYINPLGFLVTDYRVDMEVIR